MDDHLLTKEDDPEKRIAELERQLAEQKRVAGAPGVNLRYTGHGYPSTTGGRLTPEQVRNVAFSKPPVGKRGYHEDEVDAFLDLVEQQLRSQRGADPPSPQAAFPPPSIGRSPTTAAGVPQGRRRRSAWFWWLFVMALLLVAQAGLPVLDHSIPAMNRPAPSWVGLLVLVMPLVAMVVYFVLRMRSRNRRRHRYWTTGEGGGGGDGAGCSGGHSGCGGGHGGCGGGSGCGGGGCGGGGN